MANVHIFTCNSGRAYDLTQTSEHIHDGDVLIVVDEGIVGIMVEAWPIALTSESGYLHTAMDNFLPTHPEYDVSVNLAKSYILSEPYYQIENGQRTKKQYDTLDTDILRERHNVHV
jgi:hypothetical protein